MLLNSHILAHAMCLTRKVCSLVWSTWGTSLGGDKFGARDRILNTKVACCANIPPLLQKLFLEKEPPQHAACKQRLSCVCLGGGGGAQTPAEEGGGVGEMGFGGAPFVLCKDGCWRWSTNLGLERFSSPKNFPPHTCSENDQCKVGVILSHMYWG